MKVVYSKEKVVFSSSKQFKKMHFEINYNSKSSTYSSQLQQLLLNLWNRSPIKNKNVERTKEEKHKASDQWNVFID